MLKNCSTRLYVLAIRFTITNCSASARGWWHFSYSAAAQAEGVGLPLAAATLAAMINMGPVMSVTGNEMRCASAGTQIFLFKATGLVACAIGFTDRGRGSSYLR